jgi:outer membrane protein assembly factor BamB
MDGAPASGGPGYTEAPRPGQPIAGDGVPAEISGSWPWFRGANLDAICDDGVRLTRDWPPKELWRVSLGQGYAAPVVQNGRLYLLDYVEDKTVARLRTLSHDQAEQLADALANLPKDDSARVGDDRSLKALLRQLLFEEEAESEDAVAAFVDEMQALVAEKRVELISALRQGTMDAIDRSTDTMRCLSLADGKEIWQNSYPVVVPWNHGMSRTVAAVVDKYVISFGPKCQVACWDAETGESIWLLDLVLEYQATVPQWYAGQCPLIDGDRLILASGGKALLLALDYKTGEVLWESPNDREWAMTHSSVVPMEFAGQKMYVYCGSGGVAGVSTEGTPLWDTTAWKIKAATCPSPVIVPEGKIFLCGGYNAGAMILQLKSEGGRFTAETVVRLKPRQFSSEQQTPVLYNGYLYGVRQQDDQLVCLDLDGKQVWSSDDKYGSGPYMIADGTILVLDDEGWLSMVEASPTGYNRLTRACVIVDAVDSWGPMALVAGRLLVRDMTRMVCLDLREQQ